MVPTEGCGTDEREYYRRKGVAPTEVLILAAFPLVNVSRSSRGAHSSLHQILENSCTITVIADALERTA